MRAAEMKERPSFPLMRQSDVQSIYHMQMPRWLFSDPRYVDMSLEAKLTYTVLLDSGFSHSLSSSMLELAVSGILQSTGFSHSLSSSMLESGLGLSKTAIRFSHSLSSSMLESERG